MIVDDAISGFLHECLNERVVVLVSVDVDAACACKILQALLQCHHILYSVVPVADRAALRDAFRAHADGVRHFVLLNCGAAMDLWEHMDPQHAEYVFYLCDSHRPVHLNNYYNQKQVKLVTYEEQFDYVPEFEAIFRDDDEEEDDEDSGRMTDALAARRQARRAWEAERAERLLTYQEFSWHAASAALTLYELAQRTSAHNSRLLWLAVVGHTSQLLTQRISREQYMESIEYLQGQTAHLAHRVQAAHDHLEEDGLAGQPSTMGGLRLIFTEELQLWLYRHRSLERALLTSPVTACRFRVFTQRGKTRLAEFLVNLGLPRRECVQRFESMSVELRARLSQLLAEHGPRAGLDRRALFLPSFVAHSGCRLVLGALDAALVCVAALEQPHLDGDVGGGGTPDAASLLDVLRLLGGHDLELLRCGLRRTEQLLDLLATQVQTFLDTNQVMNTGRFLYAYMPAGPSSHANALTRPITLNLLAKFTLQAYASLGRMRNADQLPLVMLAEQKHSEKDQSASEPAATEELALVLGIPPLRGRDDLRNFFGAAFRQAADSCRVRCDERFFDSNLVEIRHGDKTKFLDALIAILT